MRRASILLLPLLFAACQPPAPKLAGSGMDMFAPTTIRLHPLTRFIALPPFPVPSATAPSGTQPSTPMPPMLEDRINDLNSRLKMLEARLEFTDQFTDATKGAGIISLQLYDQPAFIHKGSLLESWTLPLTTPDENKDHWDRTTRTYVFRLPLSKPLPAGRDHLLLTAALTLPNAQVLTVEMQLPTK